MIRPLHLWSAALAGFLAACAAPLVTMPDAQEGAMLFADNCTACHDYRGTGSTELVGGQRAPNLTVLARDNDGTFPRAHVLTVMDGFGQGAHRIMPEFGALLRGETVPVEVNGVMTPTPRPLAAILFYLESIQVE